MIYNFYGFIIILNDSDNKMIYRYENVKRPDEVSYKNNEQYVKEYNNGDAAAMTKLIKANSGLIHSLAGRYSHYLGSSLSEEDLVQVGYIGLMKAVKRYDRNHDNKFSTYAYWWIKKEMLSEKDSVNSIIRIPNHKATAAKLIKSLRNQSMDLYGKIDVAWICQKADITKKQYRRLIQVDQEKLKPMSLNHPISDNESSQLADILPDTKQSMQAIIENDFLREDLYKQLHQRLTSREVKVIIERYDFDNQGQRTLSVIGQEIGVTKERVRQIEKQAIDKLRDIDGLKDYFFNN
ncbi:sigma-70 family RNA polymerase sigma factor [Companilactobacillus bobalius]|uniref:RNA polymerase sigma factor sigC n=2 Tax=Companilactobacillus bobalius TaxID=2801451 RepID=A0A202F7X6_9LACO|nr:sigma-70 family RNA polymerase sigma factor [Companilactobacillus bobalius]GEO58460.1 hypothetical protein LBO01_15890 [Companilactobacillus paralimentarius]KAE9557590.1 hypothetical protein ATN92_15675 [Companilactobacillus bobalius]KAE9563736.1 hypothetical protein ATN92_03125 [Companilactobacillus bobalius]KRK83482.1 hypothetical protein FC78_GL001438 [Companilactobacillus bobalius DSM 19674]OVE96565.1 RNA polymerase sigma factor sigC [Companilactobacillus bobalius]